MKQTNTKDSSDAVDQGYKLLKIVDNIQPQTLGSTSYRKFVIKLGKDIGLLLKADQSNLLLLVQAIKECQNACYKRDVLIEVLNLLIFDGVEKSDNVLSSLLSDTCKDEKNPRSRMWKEMANAIVSLPDLVANCGALKKFERFKSVYFYTNLLDRLYEVLRHSKSGLSSRSNEQRYFYMQINGRIALGGHSQLVWTHFTSKLLQQLNEDWSVSIDEIKHIFNLPLSRDDQISIHFELFIEPLYIPIFFYLKPTKDSGQLIEKLLGRSILTNEYLQYIICNKSILQLNYAQSKHRQSMILFNIFAYLSSLYVSSKDSTNDDEVDGGNLATAKYETSDKSKAMEHSNLLIKTLLEVAGSWSNGTKILFRPYEQNRYISSALLIGLRFLFNCNRYCLDAWAAEKIQSAIIEGIPFYLNRASREHRNLAMCIGQLVMPKIFEHIDKLNQQLRDDKEKKFNLDFDVEWDDDADQLRKLFHLEIEKIFDDSFQTELVGPICSKQTVSDDSVDVALRVLDDAHKDDGDDNRRGRQTEQQCCNTKTKRAILDDYSDKEEEDLIPCSELMDVHDADASDDEVDVVDKEGDDTSGVPIYLRDCIAGLSENNNPKYIRLCLIKAGELIDQLSLEVAEFMEGKGSQSLLRFSCGYESTVANNKRMKKPLAALPAPAVNDAVRDIGPELAQLLLYLDDQYSIEGFDLYRMKALSSLCIAAPDLVVKYLLDEFNGTNRNTRHQLDILQVLVASAQHLSGNAKPTTTPVIGINTITTTTTNASTRRNHLRQQQGTNNGFVKHASLYFYGIVRQLKADLTMPSAIVSAARSLTSKQTKLDSQRETMIRRVINGLASSKVQISNFKGGLFSPLLLLSSTSSSSSSSSSAVSPNSSTPAPSSTNQAAGGSVMRGRSCGEQEERLVSDSSSSERGDVSRLDDDSYLLSRIFFSIAMILKCVDQQPITCKLSNDLLAFIAAYRRHPDPGVREALLACLAAIRSCAPSAYFEEYLYDKALFLIRCLN